MSYLDTLTEFGNSTICKHHVALLYGSNGLHAHSSHSKQVANFQRRRNTSSKGSDSHTETAQRGSQEQHSDRKSTAREFLLSIAGMFDSGKTDGSEKIKQEVSKAIERKHGRNEDGANR